MVFRKVFRKFSALIVLLTLVLAGCGSNDSDIVSGVGGSGPTTTTVRVQSVLQRTVPSSVTSMRFSGFDASGAILFGPSTVAKAASIELTEVPVAVTNLVIEYLNAQGEVIGLGSNAVSLVAGQVFELVDPPFEDVNTELTALRVTPATLTLAKGSTQQFVATGVFANGTEADLSTTVAWSSETSATATVSQTGLVTALNPGTSSLTATLNGVSGSSQLTVTSAVLASIEVTPDNASLARGMTQQYTAIGNFSDGSKQDLTSNVQWDSSSPATATISVSGLVSTMQPGTTTITATEVNTGIVGQGGLSVTPATLSRLVISPINPFVFVGRTQQLTVTGSFSDGSTQDLTSAVTWTVATPATARIDEKGLATGLQHGQTAISATDPSSGLVGQETLTVILAGGVAGDAFLFASNTQGDSWARFLANIPPSGDIPPQNLVIGAATTLDEPEGIWYDPVNSEVWLGSQGGTSVSVFRNSDSGDVAPQRTFGIPGGGSPRGVAYDQGRDKLYVSSARGIDSSILIYDNARALNGGTPAASRSITGFGATASLYGVYLDAANDRLYAVQSGGTIRVCIFDNASTMSGDLSVVPHREILAGISQPRGVSVDLTRDILYVSNDGNPGGSVSIFANASTTNLPAGATATIFGGNALLGTDNDGVTIDTSRDELYVSAGLGTNRICVFSNASTLTGANDIAPVRTIEGVSTNLNGPGGLFFFRP